jgi:hypothetical protein
MFYTLYGKQSNVKVCMPATNQEIIDYCLANPAIAKAIAEQVGDNEYQIFKKDVIQEFAHKMDISYVEAENTIGDEIEALYQSGMIIVMEVVNELAIPFTNK